MNATMKIIRDNVNKHFKELVETLYKPEGKNINNEMNRRNMRKWLG
jgi:hypothetical protein